MISPSFSLISQRTFCFVVLAFLAFGQKYLPGQEQEAPKYTVEEYKAYQDIASEASPVKKTGLVVTFLKTYPQSALKPNVVAAYQGAINDLQKAQNWQEIITLGHQYLAAASDDIFTISMLATAYQQSKNYRQFVAFGEKVFAHKPTPNIAYYLAKAYLEMNDNPKFLQWGEKTAQLMPENHEILLELTRRFGASQNNAQAAKYARLAIKAMQSAKMPEGTPEQTWKQYQTNLYGICYAVTGNVAYENRDYNSAVTNLENALKYYKKNDLVYYNLGQSYWQLNKIDMAMLNLAKAYLLNGSTSRAAKGHLDNLYKTTHQQSLAGEDRIITRAQQELKQ
jgi:tetratricopeptide (TPR) repeat protein